jgi:hypothetical protein
MGVTSNQFFDNCADNIFVNEGSSLFGDLGVQDDLEKDITEFFAQRVVIVVLYGVKRLVRFFEEVAAQTLVSLLAIPRTSRR